MKNNFFKMAVCLSLAATLVVGSGIPVSAADTVTTQQESYTDVTPTLMSNPTTVKLQQQYYTNTPPSVVSGVKYRGINASGQFVFTHSLLNIDVTYKKEYQIYDNSGKLVAKGYDGYTNGMAIRTSAIKTNSFYSITARTFNYNTAGQAVYSAWSPRTYFSIAAKPKLKKAGIPGVKVSWGKVKGAKTYTVYISTSKKKLGKKVKTIKANKSRKVVIKKYGKSKLKAKKKYYISVVATKKVGKKSYKSIPKYYSTYRYYYR